MKTRELHHAVWMLSSAIQDITSAISALESNDEPLTIGWLEAAVDAMSKAEKAIDKTSILPF